MTNELYVPSYIQGYDAKYIKCTDLATAVLAGRLGKNIYQFYCFICACIDLWGDYKIFRDKSFFCSTNKRLKLFGLKLNVYYVRNTKELHKQKVALINEKYPISFFVSKGSLFYTNDYLRRNHSLKTIIISGYDSDRDLTMIQDIALARWDKSFLFRGAMFGRIGITDKMLDDIWEKTKEFCKEKDQYINRLMTVVTNNETLINTEIDLLKFFYEFKSESLFVREIKIFNDNLTQRDFNAKEYSSLLFERQYNRLLVIFETLELCINKVNEYLIDDYREISKNYISIRNGIVMYMSKMAVKNIKISYEKIETLVRKTEEQEIILYNFIEKIVKNEETNNGKKRNFKNTIGEF